MLTIEGRSRSISGRRVGSLLSSTALTGRLLVALLSAVSQTLTLSAFAVATSLAFGIGEKAHAQTVGSAGANGTSVAPPGTSGSGGDGSAGLTSAGSANITAPYTGGAGGNGGNGGATNGSPSGNGGTSGRGGAGGDGGGGAIFTTDGVASTNTSSIAGGNGGSGGSGGAAIGGQNLGLNSAGNGGTGGAGGDGGAGGVGVFLAGIGGTLTNLGAIAGGRGGNAGSGGAADGGNNGRFFPGGNGGSAGAGGNGGAGGVGVSFGGTGATLDNSGSVAGGTGGAPGNGGSANGGSSAQGGLGGNGGTGGAGGNGGSGGVGVLFSGTSGTLINSGTIVGGNGGAAGIGGNANGGSGNPLGIPGTPGSNGLAGQGGIGVEGAGLTINNTGGTITGGMSGDGATQAYAIQLTGGTNYIGGAGTINGGINVTGGSFQPALQGSPVGTPLTVTGPISFAPGTFYNVRITPTANDSLVATGQATLTGATVNVMAGNGTYTVGRRQILSAATRGGTFFAGVTSNLAFLMPTLTYVGDGLVFLNLQAGTTDSNPGGIDYRTAALTQNQLAVAGGLTNAGNHNGDSGPVLTALNQLTVPQARAAFDSLSGEGITATQNLAYRSAQLFNAAIFDQTTFYGSGTAGNAITLTDAPSGFLAYAPSVDTPRAPIHELADLPSSTRQPAMPLVAPNRTWRAWATGFGGAEDIHGTAVPGSATQNNTIYGGVLGVDYQLMPNYLVGVAVGGSDGQFSVPGRTTSGSTDGGHIAFYDIATFGRFYGASSTSFSYFSNRTNRFVSGFGGLVSENERGTFASNEFRSRLEFGRHFDGYGATVTPFVALELAELRSNGFNEQATSGPGNFALNVSGQSTASVPGYVGARFQRITPIGNGMILSPTLEVAYVHEFSPYRSQIATLVDLPGSTFLVDGARPSRDAAHVKAGGELAFGPRSFLFANFDGEFSGVDQFYGGKGGFRFLW